MQPQRADDRDRNATLPELLDRHTASDRPALIVAGQPTSFAELADDARRLAGGLHDLGLVAGDRVALWLPSGRAWLAALFACARLGLVAVALNPRFRSQEVGDILRRTGARAAFLRPDGTEAGPAAILAGCRPEELGALAWLIAEGDGPTAGLGGHGTTVVPFDRLLRSAPHSESVAAPDTPCVVFTTSGTTKAPKFVLHDQSRLIHHGRDVARACGLTAEKRMLLIPPMCGTYGLATTFAALGVGATLVVLPGWDPREAIAVAAAHGATHAMATDDAVSQILAASDAERPMPGMEFVGLAGVNPALGDIYERAEARGLRLAGLYGSSELQAIVAMQRPDAGPEERAGRGGFTVDPSAEFRARDPETGAVLPDGEAGELEFRVPASGMVGYLADPEATAAAFTPDGFFRTGDLGCRLPTGGCFF